MKSILTVTIATLALCQTITASPVMASDAHTTAPRIDKIDPPHWWTGMQNDTLQLFIYGANLNAAPLEVEGNGVTIVEEVEDVNPAYKIAYLSISNTAKPCVIDLSVGPAKAQYQLKERTWSGTDTKGFDASDVLYLIMPDRFADGNPGNNQIEMNHPYSVDRSINYMRHGGDLQGIRDHLDYIDDLGVTAVWVNPVLENDMPGGSYHGYATTDYYRIDPRLGDNDEWNALVDDAHSRGIKVVMDMIFNHSGSRHPWVECMPMSDWLNHPEGDRMTNFRLSTLHDPYASDYDLEGTVDGWFVKSMPDLNQRNRHLMDYLIQNSIYWIEESKIDGIRMDTYPYADSHEMARWIKAVEREYPAFTIVGECWYPTPGGEAFWQRGSKVNPTDPYLKTVMDFGLTLDEGNAAFSEPTEWNKGYDKIYNHLALDYLYPDPQNILTFLDNHDTDRFLRNIPEDLGSWKQAMAFLLTSRGIPQIYYGTEILMDGVRADGGDGNVRRDMPGGFPGDTETIFTPEGRSGIQNEAFDYLSHLLHWRRAEANEVIAKGSLKHFIPINGIYVYERRLGDKSIVVVLNGVDTDNTVAMQQTAESLPIGSQWHDIVSGDTIVINPEMTFSPRQTLILTNW